MDNGQNWRMLKNYARVFKNPIGFGIWRFRYAQNQNRAPSLWYVFVGSCLFAIFFQMKNKSKSKNISINLIYIIIIYYKYFTFNYFRTS